MTPMELVEGLAIDVAAGCDELEHLLVPVRLAVEVAEAQRERGVISASRKEGATVVEWHDEIKSAIERSWAAEAAWEKWVEEGR